jgi:hypothetical protein
MHYLPGAIFFGSKDHRNPQSEWSDILPSANLGLRPLDLHNVGKLGSYALPYVLNTNDLAALSELR